MINLDFFTYSGLVLWIVFGIIFLLRLCLGPTWWFKVGLGIFLGKGIVATSKKIAKEYPKSIQKETVAELAGKIFLRLTRLGIIGLGVTIFPIILLVNQNNLIQAQNEQIKQQASIMESTRRSSLVTLMSNILDIADAELKNSNTRQLSKGTIARISALSHSLKPYHYYEDNGISEKQLSPERAHLLVALANMEIEPKSWKNLMAISNFQHSDLTNMDLSRLNFDSINLSGSDFSGSNICYTSFRYGNLEKTVFDSTLMYFSDFSYSNLAHSIFRNIPLKTGTSMAALYHLERNILKIPKYRNLPRPEDIQAAIVQNREFIKFDYAFIDENFIDRTKKESNTEIDRFINSYKKKLRFKDLYRLER